MLGAADGGARGKGRRRAAPTPAAPRAADHSSSGSSRREAPPLGDQASFLFSSFG